MKCIVQRRAGRTCSVAKSCSPEKTRAVTGPSKASTGVRHRKCPKSRPAGTAGTCARLPSHSSHSPEGTSPATAGTASRRS